MTMTDAAARKTALTVLDKSLQVEAGAGSGKTSLLAGRIVANLANGVPPSAIAAVSFTEMAASELLTRVTSFIARTIARDVPPDIAAAFEGGPTEQQVANLLDAQNHLGDMTCTTIHGFCQRIIKPYPVEADIDPGAQILDPVDAELAFEDIFDKWLRARLSGHDADENIITSIVSIDAKSGVALIRSVADNLRHNPGMKVARSEIADDMSHLFAEAVDAFEVWYKTCGYLVPEHDLYLDALKGLRDTARGASSGSKHLIIMRIAEALRSNFLITSKNTIRTYKVKGKWQAAAPSKADGTSHNDLASIHFDTCCSALEELRRKVAAAALSLLHDHVKPLIEAYDDYKRNAAFLDFSDLLTAAHKLLETHPEIREALGKQYTHILVDEFQDTDPLQTQIFLNLAFDLKGDQWVPRPGSIFLVGDPKQAIYRFRGADVNTYVRMREIMRTADEASVLSVSTNFRSLGAILDHVNEVFKDVLSVDGQPGFTSLTAHRSNTVAAAVAYFDVDDHSPRDDGKDPKIGDVRDREAAEIADICARLIGSYEVFDNKEKTGKRLCHPGDIALLVPQGTELYRYENALERAGIAVATQAGKGLYRQQEVHDLIALTRVLADSRDTLALGAFLRGPLIGLTEQELLDQSHRLPPREDGSLTFIRVGMDISLLSNTLLIDAMSKLESLRGEAEHSTPHALLNKAVDVFMIRPKITARFHGNPERQLSNVDRYLEMCRPYSVRGLRTFSDAMRSAWEDSDRIEEGRPDEQQKSVSLITMHSAKGLEWPIVIPVNIVTSPFKQSSIITDVSTNTMTMPFMGLVPEGYEDARFKAEHESMLERMRIWYVATTRARDLLILPRYSQDWKDAWFHMVDLRFDLQQVLDLTMHGPEMPDSTDTTENGQSSAEFAAEKALVASAGKEIVWQSPSLHEWSPALSDFVSEDDMVSAVPDLDPYAGIQGGAERGTILHKLMEEVLNGETEDDYDALHTRSSTLIRQFIASREDKVSDLIPDEMARSVRRTLDLPIVVKFRPRLIPEIVTVDVNIHGDKEIVEYGVIDSAAVQADGRIDAIFDWKSDIRPTNAATAGYIKQVRRYIEMNDVEKGYIVFMATGKVVEVVNTQSMAA